MLVCAVDVAAQEQACQRQAALRLKIVPRNTLKLIRPNFNPLHDASLWMSPMMILGRR